jgi:D-serine deaminase-like pyridoxal phosphate-dependent protein
MHADGGRQGNVFKSAPGDGHEPIPVGTNVLTDGCVFAPVMVLKQTAVEHNLEALARYSRTEGVLLAPHGKTTMSPELTQAQLDAGAWAISAATPAQVRTFWQFGVPRVLLANELVDPGGIDWIVRHLAERPDHEFLCYVDSLEGVRILDHAVGATGTGVTLDVLVEIGTDGARTGLRTLDEAVQVARAVSASRTLQLRGVAGYEGALVSGRDAQSVDKIASYCRQVAQVAATLDEQSLFSGGEVILSVGGGAYFDIVVNTLKDASLPFSSPVILIRSGSYVSHDDGLYQQISAFAQPDSAYSLMPALEIWGRILSRPEDELAFADFGRRDVPFDQGLPVVRQVRGSDGLDGRPGEGMRITALNDQHAYISLPATDPLKPGDWIGCGISHPCTAFDKWRHIPLVDDGYVVTGSVTTYF